MAFKSINVFDNPSQIGKWGSIKSRISRILEKYKEGDDIDLILQVKNEFTQINYSYDELPDSLDELLKEFPESVDLEYSIYENGVSNGQIGYLKRFKEVKEESSNTIKEEKPITKDTILPQNQNPTPQNNQPSIDINTLVMQISDMNERNMERFASLISTKSSESKTETKSSDSAKLEETLRQQIADLKIEHEKLVTELKNIIREEKEKASTASSQLFQLQIENTKLAMAAAQNVSPQTVDAKVEEAMRAFERNQKKLQEQIDEKKKEYDALNLAVIERKIQSQLKNNPENSELDKAVADVFRSKVPTIIDRGIELMTSIPRNGKDITPTPII